MVWKITLYVYRMSKSVVVDYVIETNDEKIEGQVEFNVDKNSIRLARRDDENVLKKIKRFGINLKEIARAYI